MTNFLDRVYRFIDILLGLMTAAIIIIVFLNVVMRTLFNSGFAWSEELSRYLFVFITYIGAISAMRSNSHLGMDTLVIRLSRKGKLFSYILSQSLITILMIMLAHGNFKMVIQSMGAKTAALGIPFSFLYGIGIVTGVAIAVNAVANIFKIIKDPAEVEQLVKMHESEDESVIESIENNEVLAVTEDLKNSLQKEPLVERRG